MRAQEDIQADLGISAERMGLVLGAFWLAYALFEIPGGWMGDRYGSNSALALDHAFFLISRSSRIRMIAPMVATTN